MRSKPVRQLLVACWLLLLSHCSVSLPSWFRRKLHVSVDTRHGKVVGWNDGDVQTFLGVPYAEPPVGPLRFRPPQPKKSWYPETLYALNFSAECLQSDLFIAPDGLSRDEDCLYLNIWRPSRVTSLRPVLVWFYGGAFIHGGSAKPEYESHELARQGVVVVTFNYRLGVLGFLVSTADGLYGNYGLGDQKAALQWVQDNIHAFGGDPGRVTLFGESAGAMSIGLHLLDQELTAQYLQRRGSSPASALFHHVILQSNPLGYKYRSLSVANFIGEAFKEHVDCDDLRCLQAESADELIHVQDILMAVPRSIGDFFTWGPVVTDAAFYRELRLRAVPPSLVANVSVYQPMSALRALDSLRTPVLLGSNAHEGTMFVFTAYPARMKKLVFSALVLSMFRSASLRVLRTYSGLIRLVDQQRVPDYRVVLAQILGDYLFACPTQRVAMALAQLSTHPRTHTPIPAVTSSASTSAASATASVFLYEFRLPTRTPGFPFCSSLSCHTSELPYVFRNEPAILADYMYPAGDTGYAIGLTTTAAHLEVARLMSEYWTTFAKFGDVNGAVDSAGSYVAGTGVRAAVAWPPVVSHGGVSGAADVCALAQLEKAQSDESGEWEAGNEALGEPEMEPVASRDGEDDMDDFRDQVRIGRGVAVHDRDPVPGDSVTRRTLRRLVFSERSELVEEDKERDCLCLFWDSLRYRF